MDTFITIATFNTIHESAYLKAMLEAEGIECFFKDEFMVQSSWYANAVGGMKLQIKKEDLEKALPILKEAGFLEEEEQENVFLNKLETFTAKIPFVGKLSFVTRIFISSGLLIFLLAIPFYYATLPGIQEQMVNRTWYISSMSKNGQRVHPNTYGYQLTINGMTIEYFSIDDNGRMDLPGVNSYRVRARWRLEDDMLIIFEADTLKELYEGKYDVEVDEGSILLRSKTTEIGGFDRRY